MSDGVGQAVERAAWQGGHSSVSVQRELLPHRGVRLQVPSFERRLPSPGAGRLAKLFRAVVTTPAHYVRLHPRAISRSPTGTAPACLYVRRVKERFEFHSKLGTDNRFSHDTGHVVIVQLGQESRCRGLCPYPNRSIRRHRCSKSTDSAR